MFPMKFSSDSLQICYMVSLYHTYSGNEFIHGNKNSSYTVDPREQFGTHENLSWGCMVGPTGPRPIIVGKTLRLSWPT